MATYGWVTELEADTYFDLHYTGRSYWDAETSKAAALLTAYRQLVGCNYFLFPSVSTTRMKYAQFEQALFIIMNGEALDRRAGLQAQGVTRSEVVGEYYSFNGVPIAPAVLGLVKDMARVGKAYYRAVDLIRSDCLSGYSGPVSDSDDFPVEVATSELLVFSGQFNGVQSNITLDGNEIAFEVEGNSSTYLIESIQIVHADNFDADATTKVRVSTGSVDSDNANFITAQVAMASSSGVLVAGSIQVSNTDTIYAYVSQAGNHQDVQIMIKVRANG